MRKILGLAFRQNEKITINPPRPFIQELDDVPMPDLDIAQPLKRYPGVFPYLQSPSLHTITSRGCPFSCSFCSNPVWGHKVRRHSINRILDEMERLIKQYNAREIYIMDDTLNVPIDRAKAVFKGVIKRGLHEKSFFRCCFRANEKMVDKELLRLAEQANVWLIFYGVETGNAKISLKINKKITLDEMERAIRLTREAGIRTICSFMIGNLDETFQTVRDTIEFAKNWHPITLTSRLPHHCL